MKTAIKQSGTSKARCLDNIYYANQNQLGSTALTTLVDSFNLPLKTNTILAIWKIATVIPILKPGKDPRLAASYNHLYLLSNISKVLESLFLSKITLTVNLSPTQHGFISQHSTTTLLANHSKKILESRNNNNPAQHSIVAAVDISKAFDTVRIPTLISKNLATDLHPNNKK